MAQKIEAEIPGPNGPVILEFPEGTPKEVIKLRVQEQIAKFKALETEEIGPRLPPAEMGPIELAASKAQGIGPQGPYQSLRNNQPYISGGIGALAQIGAAATGIGIFGAGLANSVAMSGTDAILNKFLYKTPQETFPISEALGRFGEEETPTQNPYANTAWSMVENVLTNEFFGRLIPTKKAGNVLKGAKNIVKEARISPQIKEGTKFIPEAFTAVNMANRTQSALAIVRDKFIQMTGMNKPTQTVHPLESLEPSFSQMRGYDSTVAGGKVKGKYAEWIENLFAPGLKKQSLEKSAKLAIAETEKMQMLMTGDPVPMSLVGEVGKSTLNEAADRLQKRTQIHFKNLENDLLSSRAKLEPLYATEQLYNGATKGSPQAAALLAQVQANNPIKQKLEAELLDGLTAKLDFFPDDPDLKRELIRLTKPLASEVPYGQKVEAGLSVKNLISDPVTGKEMWGQPVINEIVLNRNKMKNFISTGTTKVGNRIINSDSPKRDLKGYAYQMHLQNSYDVATDTLDISKFQNDWNKYIVSGPGKELYSSFEINNIDQQFKRFAAIGVQNKEIGASRYLTLRLATGTATIMGGLISALMGGTAKGLGTAGTITSLSLVLHQLGKLSTNKDTARLMLAATHGGPLNMSHVMASRLIMRALRGETVTAELKDGSGNPTMVKGKIDNDGKFVANKDAGFEKESYAKP